MQEKVVNPITGEFVDELVKESVAKERGYFDYQFMLKYLEDENEFVKYFIIDGKKIIVDMAKPNLQYKKPLNLNYERIYNQPISNAVVSSTFTPVIVCNLDDDTCVSCSG